MEKYRDLYGSVSIFDIRKQYQIKLLTESIEWGYIRRALHSVKIASTCMCCGAIDSLEVDHILPKSIYPKLAFDISNLQILCCNCNSDKSNTDYTDYRNEEQKVKSESLTSNAWIKELNKRWISSLSQKEIFKKDKPKVDVKPLDSFELSDDELKIVMKISGQLDKWFFWKVKMIKKTNVSMFNKFCSIAIAKNRVEPRSFMSSVTQQVDSWLKNRKTI
ncbi:hypothetical protein A9Q84_00065 [Halobacteriovorax marinus]|uniref:HNH nuclease domain-containing protein n=1 Tax=Halobacteriovorax marinus TaxID=97084 RepID=A0A1Y5FD63_9BACT|nr:hypothetical protein A9Q84_00065 [Halobacteriovorax marinus]